MSKTSPEAVLLFVSCCLCAAALLDALFWYLIWRQERRWQYIGANGRDYCRAKIKQRLVAAVGMACLALIAVDQGAWAP